MRCDRCLHKVHHVRGMGLTTRCAKCQEQEVRFIVDACVQRGWEAQVENRRGRLRVSVHTPIGQVTLCDTEDLLFLDVDVAT